MYFVHSGGDNYYYKYYKCSFFFVCLFCFFTEHLSQYWFEICTSAYSGSVLLKNVYDLLSELLYSRSLNNLILKISMLYERVYKILVALFYIWIKDHWVDDLNY